MNEQTKNFVRNQTENMTRDQAAKRIQKLVSMSIVEARRLFDEANEKQATPPSPEGPHMRA